MVKFLQSANVEPPAPSEARTSQDHAGADEKPEPAPVRATADVSPPSLDEPDLPPPVDNGPAPATAALEVLERFLAAGSLEERMPLMDTSTPEDELAASVLSGPLPPRRNVDTELVEPDKSNELTNVFFRVEFERGEGKTEAHLVLVRVREAGGPRVAAEPFLDLFGGRLAEFASSPRKGSGEFHAVVEPLSFSAEGAVPNHERKLTLKLLASDGRDEIARAYFGEQSEIGRILLDGPAYAADLTFGQVRPCVVVLVWNTSEDPEKPYLEALRMQALNWAP